MKKLLLLVAFAAGYVLGAKAGRQRYEQIMNAANRVKDDPHVRSAASTVAETAKEQAPVAAHKVAAAASTAASAVADRSPFGTLDFPFAQPGCFDWCRLSVGCYCDASEESVQCFAACHASTPKHHSFEFYAPYPRCPPTPQRRHVRTSW